MPHGLITRASSKRLLGALGAVGILALSPAAVAATGTTSAGVHAATTTDPGSYVNPLDLQIPGDGKVQSCADPNVIKGVGDAYWYLYCTTDPINASEKDAQGNLVFHHIPMLRSRDLVHWVYVGDAFPQLPSIAAGTAALWAPDVVYSKTYDKYYMTFVVTDTTAAAGGSDTCTTDNAIGVATSDSPTGPWVAQDSPVVGPRPASATACDYLWTYDPDVLGWRIGTNSYLYYGSYYGGIFGTRITFTATGATADVADATRITIDNRYEGSNVIYHDGYYYLFVSATNCCNGALTGYSVFAGRSEHPLGPYVDREGNSLLSPYVGGTPVLSMNGNKWIGTGHNTVFQDFSGQWWTIYHAVNQRSPFFAGHPGFTRRPALLDAIDWVDGWPTVNGGRWASAGPVPAPAAQPGQVSHHRTVLVSPQTPGRLIAWASDNFNGDQLSDQWTWVRKPATLPTVHDGMLSWPTQAADIYVDNNTASVLTRKAPAGNYVVTVKLRLNVPAEGVFNYVQGGVVIYGDDDNFIKLADVSIWDTRQTEFAKELAPVPDGWARYGNTVVGPPSPGWTYLRIVVERLSGTASDRAGGDTEAYTAYTSQDGAHWVRGGTWTHHLGTLARIGLVSMGGSGFTTDVDYVHVSTLAG